VPMKKIVMLFISIIIIRSAIFCAETNIFLNDKQGLYVIINTENVDLREMPNNTAKIKCQLNKGTIIRVSGISPIKEQIGGSNNYWFFIRTYLQNTYDYITGNPVFDKDGWVYGQYITGINDIEPTKQQISINSKEIIYDNYKIDITERLFDIGNNMSAFELDDNCSGYTYRNCPGVYIVDQKTNTVVSYTSFVIEVDYNRIDISKNQKYLLISLSRWELGWISIIDITKRTHLFSGNFMNQLNFNGTDLVDVCYSTYFDNFDELSFEEKKINEETLKLKPDGNCQYLAYMFVLNITTMKRERKNIFWFYGQ